MYPGADPFETPAGVAFGTPSSPPVTYGGHPDNPFAFGAQPGPSGGGQGPQGDYNLCAALAPVFGVLVPPAGIALGHIALSQIDRTNERGRPAAITGLVLGYVLTVALLIGALLWGVRAGSSTDSTGAAASASTSAVPAPATAAPTPSVVTSIAAPTSVQRIKLDLATVPIGTCVQIQMRSTESSEALDLFKTDCIHHEGVYTVTSRVDAGYQCSSEYVASPPDRAFALCLNRY